jgi:hypothetical protein
MNKPVLTDKNIFPNDEIVFSIIGKKKDLWISLFRSVDADHPEFIKEWRYYNDGKSWLMKVVHKKKTVFWLSVIEGTFRITFYFTDKAKHAIENSGLSDELKEQFKDSKRYNKIRGLTISFKTKKDCACAEELIGIKLSMK